MSSIVQTFHGFSGNEIYLMEGPHGLFVRKIGQVQRNIERLTVLSDSFPVPKIYASSDSVLDMEYIHGLDIKTYLIRNQPDRLIKFLTGVLTKLSNRVKTKDYSEVYKQKINDIDFAPFPFTQDELLSKLPRCLPQSNYLGDLTLENIIYTEDGFYLIDCATIEYDSYVFDIAKLRQDLECHWFARGDDVMLDVKTNYIQQELLSKFPLANNDYLLIMMLLRVYKYADVGSAEYEFLLKGIKKLWK